MCWTDLPNGALATPVHVPPSLAGAAGIIWVNLPDLAAASAVTEGVFPGYSLRTDFEEMTACSTLQGFSEFSEIHNRVEG